MKRVLTVLLAAVAVAVTSVTADASAIPSPQSIGYVNYGRYHARPTVLVVARPTFARICPATGGYQLVNRQPCDPFSLAYLTRGQRVQAGGYIMARGHRFFWVDLGVNIYGGHDYGWIAGTDVWAGWWAFRA